MTSLRPRLLVLTNKLPYPPDSGDKIRLYNFLTYLSRGWRIDLLAYIPADLPAPDTSELHTLCASVTTVPLPQRASSRWQRYKRLIVDPRPAVRSLYTPEMAAAVREALATTQYDAVLVSSLPMAQFIANSPMRRKTVYDQVDVYYVNCLDAARRLRPRARPYFYVEALKLRRYERKLASGRFGRCVVVSDGDARALRLLSPSVRVDVIPNGVDTHYFQPLDSVDSCQLVFTGTMGYWPNVDAMTYFCREIMPRITAAVPGAHLNIVGHSPLPDVTALASNHVTVTGRVADIRPYIAAAAVFVAPFRVGTGTHLKILEAMSMGKAIVSTSRGTQGLGTTDGQNVGIGDDAATFAKEVIRLLRDAEARRRMGEAARAFVVSTHDWTRFGCLMDDLLRQVASPGDR